MIFNDIRKFKQILHIAWYWVGFALSAFFRMLSVA